MNNKVSSTHFYNQVDEDLGWDGITKATPLKVYPPEEPNPTNPDEVLEKIKTQVHISSHCSKILSAQNP